MPSGCPGMFCRSEMTAPTVEQAAKSPAAATARQSIAGTGCCPGEGSRSMGAVIDRSLVVVSSRWVVVESWGWERVRAETGFAGGEDGLGAVGDAELDEDR